MFRIGDFSKLSQVSIKALRFYDEIGLLKPTYVDSLTGYRYYAANLLSRLNRILILKELGFSLEEITPLLEGDLQANQVREALQVKRGELERKIEEERLRLARVDAWLGLIAEDGRVPDYQIRLKHTPRQLVASVREPVDSYQDAALLFAEIDSHLKKHGAAGPYAAIWHSCESQGRPLDCEAMVLLNGSVPDSKRVKVYELPARSTACIIHQGNDDTSRQAYAAVRSWIKSHGYMIAGPNHELYWQGGVAQDDASNVTEIQYPITVAHKSTQRNLRRT